MKRTIKLVVISVTLLCAVMLGFLFRLTECRHTISPDGRFYAVASCRAWRTLVPMAPGSGGDKPGYVTVFTREGQPCGTAPLPMASMIDEMEWSPTHAEVPLVAEWDLVTHAVHY